MHLLPILNPEIRTTRRMEKWLRSRCTVRRMLRLELWTEDPHCAYCRRPLACPDAGVLDHATPRSRGGGDRPSNAMLCCRQCDQAKGRRTISEWKADLLAGLFALPNPERANDTPVHDTEAKSTGHRRNGEPAAALPPDTGGDSGGMPSDPRDLDAGARGGAPIADAALVCAGDGPASASCGR
jgi:hypothetical protein